MKVLVIGLGSMGRRRVRNLQAIGGHEIVGTDIRPDRRTDAAQAYAIPVIDDVDSALDDVRPDAVVISTGPAQHMDYAFAALERGAHCFIEASVIDADRIRTLATRVAATDLVFAPSCTMRYFAGPREVKRAIASGRIGRPLNFNYHTGQYLPDWHPWERIEDFYVSRRETGGCREIVPFELTWLSDVFGNPEPLACVRAKLTDMPADIDDIYHSILRFPKGVLGSMTVEVISRPHATRELRVLGTEGEIVFSAHENVVRVASAREREWHAVALDRGHAEGGYINPEEPYIEEMRDFVDAAASRDRTKFPNSLEADARLLDVLEQLDALSERAA